MSDAMLKEYCSYDPETGIIVWEKSPARCVRPGAIVGSVTSGGYLNTAFKGKKYYVHRIAWFLMTGKWPSKFLDHINGNKQDNRFENLREATLPENSRNAKLRDDNKSGVKGVFWRAKRGKWSARIMKDGKNVWLGSFALLDDAKNAYNNAATQIYGEFARLNGATND